MSFIIQMYKVDVYDDFYLFLCPHCNMFIIVKINEVHCKIFRHGIYKKNYELINPHESKQICDDLVKSDEIFGCGKPFKLIEINKELFVDVCDYI